MLLLGQFSDDISMYAMRNPRFNLMTLVSTVLQISDTNFKTLKSLLKGRMFAACTQISDLIDVHSKETAVFINVMIRSTIDAISSKLPISV